jgi:hypothetical protein
MHSVIGLLGIFLGFTAITSIVFPLYERMFSRLWQFGTHIGAYGSGPAGIPDAEIIFSNFLIILFSGKGWHIWLFGILAYLIFSLVNKFLSNNQPDQKTIFIIVFSSVAITTSYILAMFMENMALRYFLPTGIIGLLIFCTAIRLTSLDRIKKYQIPIALFAGLLLIKHIAVDIESHSRRILDGYKMQSKITKLLKNLNPNKTQPITLYSFRVPMPSYGLREGALESQLSIIDTHFPNEGHYDVWNRRIHLPTNRSNWDYLIIREMYLKEFPGQLSPVLASLGEYKIVIPLDQYNKSGNNN